MQATRFLHDVGSQAAGPGQRRDLGFNRPSLDGVCGYSEVPSKNGGLHYMIVETIAARCNSPGGCDKTGRKGPNHCNRFRAWIVAPVITPILVGPPSKRRLGLLPLRHLQKLQARRLRGWPFL